MNFLKKIFIAIVIFAVEVVLIEEVGMGTTVGFCLVCLLSLEAMAVPFAFVREFK